MSKFLMDTLAKTQYILNMLFPIAYFNFEWRWGDRPPPLPLYFTFCLNAGNGLKGMTKPSKTFDNIFECFLRFP